MNSLDNTVPLLSSCWSHSGFAKALTLLVWEPCFGTRSQVACPVGKLSHCISTQTLPRPSHGDVGEKSSNGQNPSELVPEQQGEVSVDPSVHSRNGFNVPALANLPLQVARISREHKG